MVTKLSILISLILAAVAIAYSGKKCSCGGSIRKYNDGGKSAMRCNRCWDKFEKGHTSRPMKAGRCYGV